jgi:CheY-like chemotaxis protein/tetratricopeptide (TPR) repeat protein
VPRILLAEGHGPTREFVTRSCSDAGFEVLTAQDPAEAYEVFASQRPVVVILGADFADGGAAALAGRLRAADARALVVVTDKEHLGRAVGLQGLLPVKANAYVADPTKKELVEKVQHLVAQAAVSRHAPTRGAALVLSRGPAGRGNLKPGAVARTLHQIWRALSEGILVLEQGGRERRLLFLRGAPVACQSDDPAETLVGWLAASGRIDPPRRAAALEGMASGLSPGAALIAAGVLEPGEPLREAMRDHVRAMVVRALAAKDGRWRFHPGPEFSTEIHAAPVAPLPAILEGARAGIPSKHFADALRGVMEAHPARTGEFQQLLPACALSAHDLRLALSLDGRDTTRAWLDARQKELKEALSLLWFLGLVSGVAFQEEPAAGDAYARAAPRKKKPLPPERAEALRQAALQILPGTYFQALGVDIGADTPEVERAYHEVASRFHPDGFAEYEAGDVADLLAAVQDKVTAAWRVLSSEEKRRAYLSFLLPKLELVGARRPGIDLDAEVALKRGERALLARRSAEAVQALRVAVERNPKEPEYHAMLGFAELFDPVLPPASRAQEARRAARRALGLAPEHPRATVVLALAEEALGDAAEARRVVLSALKAHPGSEVLKQALHRLNRTR